MADGKLDYDSRPRPSLANVQLRFVAAFLTTGLGVLLAVGAFTLGTGSERWLALGVGAAALILTLIAFAAPYRGTVQRLLDPFLTLSSIWAIVFARVIAISGAGSSAHSVKWWEFACGAAIGAIGAIGLLLHEAGVERELRDAAEPIVISYSVPAQPRPTRDGRPVSSPISSRRGSE